MNSRPSFSIRRLIPQRRPGDVEGRFGDSAAGGLSQDAPRRASREELPRGSSMSSQRGRAWTRTKKPPQPIVVVSGSEAVHMISGPLPPLPDTPHSSSASSLCSCACRASPRTPASATPPLCSSRSKTPDTLSPSLSPCAVKLEEMGFLLQDDTDSMMPLTLVQTLSPVSENPHSGQDGGSTARSRSPVDQRTVDDMSENVRQLIRETDEAFRAVGTVLSEARMASASSTLHHHDSKFAMALAQSPAWPRSRAGPRSPLRIVSPLSSPTRKASISKTKRKKSKKGRRGQPQQETQQQQQEQQRNRPAAAQKNGPRWALTENVSELLNGRLFHRLEVDEIQTPDQLQEWRQKNRPLRADVNMSTETLRTFETDGSETPIEPFHLDDLPSRIGAAGVRLSHLPSPIVDTASASAFDFGLNAGHRDLSLERQQHPQPQSQPRQSRHTEPGDPDAMTFKNVSFPAPPLKSPMRLLPRRQLPPLPTIPEVMVTGTDGPLGPQQHPGQQHQETLSQQETPQQTPEMQQAKVTDEFVVLHCSPFTVTMPTFRHGPIRFSRSEINVKHLAADETLDWTAFQMAILGGAGDLFSDSVDFTRAADVDEADELADWFEGLGVGGIGRLSSSDEDQYHDELQVYHNYGGESRNENGNPVHTEDRAEVDEGDDDDDDDDATERAGSVGSQKGGLPTLDTTMASQRPPSPAVTAEYSPVSSTGSSSPSTQPEMVEIRRCPPIPLVIERPPGLWNARFEFAGQGIRRWVLESAQQQQQQQQEPEHAAKGRAGSQDSLPQSPMLDLVVGRGAGGEEFLVPMGYNLGHDLGDFLKWESENVYAPAFYG